MKINRVSINYYKSIKEPMVLHPLPVNIFIGQNNSGKSNIFDAIEFALKNLPENSNYYYSKADIELSIEFSEDDISRLQLKSRHAKFILKNGERYFETEAGRIDYNQSWQKFFKAVKRLDTAAFSNFAQIESDYQTLFNYPANMERFRSSLREHFPKISASKNALDLKYEHEGLYEGKRRVTIDRLGSGFQRVFVMLLYIFHPEYSLIIIDEPETHLHPAIIKRLLWAIENSLAGQVFFATHSPLFIRPFTLPQVVRVIKIANTTRAFTMRHIRYDGQRLTQELNADNLEMFFADKVLLVEGVSDRLLFRGLIDRFYPGDADIKVVQIQGKGNIKIYLDLLLTFQIPFAVVLDKDALSNWLPQQILEHIKAPWPSLSGKQLIDFLKNYNIFILSSGALEENYPKRYQSEDTKAANALRASSMTTQEEYDSPVMANVKEIINSL